MKFFASLISAGVGLAMPLVSAASLDTAAAQVQQPEITQPAAAPQEKVPSQTRSWAKPAQSPLQVTGGLQFDAGTLLQSETRRYELEISNPSDKEVKIINISSNCPCTRISNFADQQIIPAGQSWTMRFDIDADLIETEVFSRKIFIVSDGYERMIIQLSGKVNYIFAISPGKKISFGHLQDPEDAWEVTAAVAGLGQLAETLVLDTKVQDQYVGLAVSEISPHKFKITVTPKAVLPYADHFKYKIEIPVLKPENTPPVILWLQGSVATNLNFAPREVIVSAADFPNTPLTTKIIGCGIKDARLMEQKIREEKKQDTLQRVQHMKGIDWEKLLNNLEYELPAGVTVKKSRLDYGIQLELIIAKEAFASQQELEIKLHRGGRYFAPIKLRYRE